MIALVVRMLRPIFLPLLRLKLDVPHLPEGSTLVRELKPEENWLTLKYLGVLGSFAGAVLGAIAGSIAISHVWGPVGVAVGLVLDLFIFATLGFGLVSTRIDYELRHYLVGDKSLRVSQGALVRREVTLSYANVQNLEVTAGPLDRLFDLATLTLSTAGGSA